MTDRHQEQLTQSEQLLRQLEECERMLQACPLQKFSELRYQIKQTKEKLRSLDNLNKK